MKMTMTMTVKDGRQPKITDEKDKTENNDQQTQNCENGASHMCDTKRLLRELGRV